MFTSNYQWLPVIWPAEVRPGDLASRTLHAESLKESRCGGGGVQGGVRNQTNQRIEYVKVGTIDSSGFEDLKFSTLSGDFHFMRAQWYSILHPGARSKVWLSQPFKFYSLNYNNYEYRHYYSESLINKNGFGEKLAPPWLYRWMGLCSPLGDGRRQGNAGRDTPWLTNKLKRSKYVCTR
jgi:hypothetical protein